MSNQASEEPINAFIEKWAGDHAAHLLDSDDNDGERLRQAINAYVRTEKQKLLAEVRERAKEMYTPALCVRAVSISEIDKLEAEL